MRKELTAETVTSAVASEYGVTTAQIIGNGRQSVVAEARQMVMFILGERLGFSDEHISMLTNRSRCAVLYSRKKMADLQSVDKVPQRPV